MIIDTEKNITQSKFGALVGITRQRVSQLIESGLLKEGGSFEDWSLAYSSNLRDVKSGHGDADIQQEAAKAKTRKDNLEADLKEIKIAELTGELCDVSVMEKSISAIKDAFFRSGHEAKEKIRELIKVEFDIEIPPDLINEVIDEHLAVLEGCNPREIAKT